EEVREGALGDGIREAAEGRRLGDVALHLLAEEALGEVGRAREFEAGPPNGLAALDVHHEPRAPVLGERDASDLHLRVWVAEAREAVLHALAHRGEDGCGERILGERERRDDLLARHGLVAADEHVVAVAEAAREHDGRALSFAIDADDREARGEVAELPESLLGGADALVDAGDVEDVALREAQHAAPERPPWQRIAFDEDLGDARGRALDDDDADDLLAGLVRGARLDAYVHRLEAERAVVLGEPRARALEAFGVEVVAGHQAHRARGVLVADLAVALDLDPRHATARQEASDHRHTLG